MSGFAGFTGGAPAPGARPVLAALVRALGGSEAPAAAAAPVWLSAGGDAGLTRADAGAAAAASAGGRCVAVLDGEFYNLAGLRREVPAVAGRPPSAAEVLLHLYEMHGAGCLRWLRGQFACAIVDPRRRRVLLARDPLGVKRLYVGITAGAAGPRLVFATRLRALVAGGLVPARLDVAGLLGFLRFGAVPEPRSMIAGVRAAPAGTVLVLEDGGLRREQFWELPGLRDEGGSREAVAAGPAAAALREELLDAVRAQLDAAGAAGVLLGGGAGPAAVAALVAAAGGAAGRPFLALACGEPGAGGEAVAPAARAAAAAGGRLVERRLGSAEATHWLEEHFAGLDQPAIHGFEAWCAARLGQEAGCAALLAGTGAEALFGAGAAFTQVSLLLRLAALPSWARRPVALPLARVRAEPWRQFGEVLGAGAGVDHAWAAVRGIFPRRDLARVAAGALGVEAAELEPWARAGGQATGEVLPRFESPRELVSYLETTRQLREGPFGGAAHAAACWGTELRLPLADANVVGAAWAIPAGLRLDAGSALLTRAVPELAAWAEGSPGLAAAGPLRAWADGSWREFYRERGPAAALPPRNRQQAWVLLALDRWLGQLRGIAAAAPTGAAGGGHGEGPWST